MTIESIDNKSFDFNQDIAGEESPKMYNQNSLETAIKKNLKFFQTIFLENYQLQWFDL